METIGIVVFDNIDDLDFVGVASVIGKAKLCAKVADVGLDVVLISATGSNNVVTAAGLKIDRLVSWKGASHCCALVFPGGSAARQVGLPPESVNAIREAARRGTLLCSVCSGAFLLANIGLLSHRHVAVHGKHRALLESIGGCCVRRGFLRDGPIWSIGGVMDSGYPKSVAMGLALLEHFCPTLVDDVLERLELPRRAIPVTMIPQSGFELQQSRGS